MSKTKLMELSKDLNSLAEDNLHEIIRYGEFDPTDRVLDMVLEVLAKYEPYADIVNEAYDGDAQVSKYIVELHLAGKDNALDAMHNFNRRSKQLLREHAERYLVGIEDALWGYWNDQAVPAVGYI